MDADASDPLSPEEEGMLNRVIVDMPCGNDHLKEVAKELRGRCSSQWEFESVQPRPHGRFSAQQLIKSSSTKRTATSLMMHCDRQFDMSDIPASRKRSMSKLEMSFGSVTRLSVQTGKSACLAREHISMMHQP